MNKIERRSTKRNDLSGYAGGSLGAFFPDENLFNALENGFGGSIFIGGRWNRYLATDLEFTYIGGGTMFDDIDYSAWGLAINPRLIVPFNNNTNSASIFVSPGIGVSIVTDFSVAETDLTWQVKGGFTIPIGNKFNIILQGRYISQFEGEDNGAFGTELGFSVNFN